jgi:fructose-1,6-bisphosphatase I / sedoheptulose-1,7-bisphosphatase
MTGGRITLWRFLAEELRRGGAAGNALTAVLLDVASGVKEIAALLARGASADATAGGPDGAAERASEILLGVCGWSGHVAAMTSARLHAPHVVPHAPDGEYLLAFDPLDGASELDVNGTVGTVFSVLRRPAGGAPVGDEDFLQPGIRQVCAGYATYGPATRIVLTTGRGVSEFTLDAEAEDAVLTRSSLRLAQEPHARAPAASNERRWGTPVRRGDARRPGALAPDLDAPSGGSTVADVHRALLRAAGAARRAVQAARLPLLHAAAPLALLVEQAGGAAISDGGRLLEVVPASLHERIPAVLGPRAEVERLGRRALRDRNGASYSSPLFNERSLLREW